MQTLTSPRHVSFGPWLKSLIHKAVVLRPSIPLHPRAMASSALDDLFPIPPPRASSLVPERWPGVTAASTEALIETVKTDYQSWHVFFNDKGFHKYTFACHLRAFHADMYDVAIRPTISSRSGHSAEMQVSSERHTIVMLLNNGLRSTHLTQSTQTTGGTISEMTSECTRVITAVTRFSQCIDTIRHTFSSLQQLFVLLVQRPRLRSI
jgi:hypothetical protein